MRTTFLCTVQPPPPTPPHTISIVPDLGLWPPLAFVAAHKLGKPYAMIIGRRPPVFPMGTSGSNIVPVTNVDLHLAWNGRVRCRVPVLSASNTAYGWVIVLDAPKAIGVKLPPLTGMALTPEASPWNAWPAGEKKGKEVGDEEPSPNWYGELDAGDLARAVEEVRRGWGKWVEAPVPFVPPPNPIPPPQPSLFAEPAPVVVAVVASPVASPPPTLSVASLPADDDIELPADLFGEPEPSPPPAPMPVAQEPKAPQLALF